MSKSKNPAGASTQTTHKLRSNAPRLAWVLKAEEPIYAWRVHENPAIDVGPKEYQRDIELLKASAAIRKVGTITKENKESDRINQWELTNHAKDVLKESLDHKETLPCGHRPHIHHKEDGTFGCRYCEEERSYARETIEALL